MTIWFSRVATLAVTAALSLAPLSSATQAQTPPPSPAAPLILPDPASVQQQIKAYDPKAVAAAESYFSRPAAKGTFVAMTDSVYQQVLDAISKQHPELFEDQLNKLEPIIGDPLKRRLEPIIQMNVLNALKTFSTEELIGLDDFYKSPVGKAIQAKMPKLTEQAPAIMQSMLPGYLTEIKAKLKAQKLEVEF